MAEKRRDIDTGNGGALIKRSKPNEEEKNKSVITLSNQRSGTQNAIVGTVIERIHRAFYVVNILSIGQAHFSIRSTCDAINRSWCKVFTTFTSSRLLNNV